MNHTQILREEPAIEAPSAQFGFSPAQDQFRQEVADFAATLADTAHERASNTVWFPEIYRELGKRGYLSFSVPKAVGGREEKAVTTGILLEEIARRDVHVGFSVFNAMCTHELIAKFGSQQLRDEWLAPALQGEKVVAFSITEAAAGSDARGIQSRATKVDGGWRLTASKTSSGFAAVADATIFIAKTGDGHNDFGAFFVPLNQDGIWRDRIHASGFKPTGRGKYELEDVFVPDEHVIGTPGHGYKIVMKTFDYTRAIFALLAVGVAKTGLDMAVEFGRERETFGAPLSTRQGYTFVVAEHLAKVEAARMMCYRVLGLKDAGQPFSTEAAMAKYLAADFGVDTMRDVMVLHGQRSYAEDLPIWQMTRDMQGLEIAEGTPQILKMIIARAAFGPSHASTRTV